MNFDRRQLLNAALVMALLGPLKGCRKPIVPRCPFGEDYDDPDSRLTIDVHSHIFNATDLQVKKFVQLVASQDRGALGAVARLLAGPLQSFAWATAPNVAQERAELEKVKRYIEECDREEVSTRLLKLRDDKYEQGRIEIETAARSRMAARAISDGDLAAPPGALPAELLEFRRLTELPATYEQLFAPGISAPAGTPLPDSAPQTVTFWSAIKFIIEMLQYRYASIFNYLHTYNRKTGAKTDLLMPALVDYDWWLNKGAPTKSKLPDQMQLMKEISILTGGRVHALVPFDPFRQVVFDPGQEDQFSPIELVRTAVEDLGAIGVKLYSPMGFAPYGNESVGDANPGFWDRDWLPDSARSPGFGKQLDGAMETLFTYCGDKGVPVMGHSNHSNGPAGDFEALTGPEYWKMAADEFPNAPISFGHFGGAGSESDDESSPLEGFLNLLASDQAAGTNRLAADASYFSYVIDDPDYLRGVMQTIYEFRAGDSPAATRLMYGTDWKMLVAEAGAEKYLADFEAVISDLEEATQIRGLPDNFFGANAAAFFGLKAGQPNRTRLENFYDAAGFEELPTWMTKVDDL